MDRLSKEQRTYLKYYDYGSFTANTTAVYQAENAAVAIRTCEILKNDCGFDKIEVKSIKEGIRNMRWAGRMEEIMPGVFVDGAHNEDGIEVDFSIQQDLIHRVDRLLRI